MAGKPRLTSMSQTIKRGMSKLQDAALSVHAQHILENMTGNLNYPTPTPTLPTITTALTEYEESLGEAESRDKQKVLIKNLRRKKLKDLLDKLFTYVNLTGGTDIEILTSSGFPLAKERRPVGEMPKPENFRVRQGDGAGQVHLSVKKVHGADSYIYQYIVSPSPEVENWTSIADPATRIMIEGLEPGTQYKFRAAAVGAKGQGPWSDVITRFVS